MKNSLLLLVLIIGVGYSANGQNTNHERVLQIQTIENGDSFLLIQKSIGNAELNSSSSLDSLLVFIRHKPFKGDINIIILDTILGNNGRRQGRLLNKEYQINELYIKFIDSNVGFFYGSYWSYMSIPFIHKTHNAGKTWFSQDSLPWRSLELRKDDFYIHGDSAFLLLDVIDSSNYILMKYLVSYDGGINWNEKTFKFKENLTYTHYDLQFSSFGLVAVTLNFRDKKLNTKQIVLQSNNHGETFIIKR